MGVSQRCCSFVCSFIPLLGFASDFSTPALCAIVRDVCTTFDSNHFLSHPERSFSKKKMKHRLFHLQAVFLPLCCIFALAIAGELRAETLTCVPLPSLRCSDVTFPNAFYFIIIFFFVILFLWWTHF